MLVLSGQSLISALNDYLINYTQEAGLKEKTVKNKKDILYPLLKFLDGKEYCSDSVRQYIFYKYEHGWKTPNSRLDLTKVLRAFTNFLYKRKYIDVNFASELIKTKIPNPQFDYVDPLIVEKIIIAGTTPSKFDNSRNIKIKGETRFALRFILRTGLRISEVINIKGNDLNLYDNPQTFWVNSKGGNRDLLPLPKDLVPDLMDRISRERVFPVTAKTCNISLKRGSNILDIKAKITNHTLRHIFATNLTKKGSQIQLVSRLMRHSSVEITDKTYTHLNVADLSLIINSQDIVREGLSNEETYDNILKAIKGTGIERDKRFKLTIGRMNDVLTIQVIPNIPVTL